MSLDARHQALLSEYKGNLFEFLVAVSIARRFKYEGEFLRSLSDDFKKMLQIQESFIREFYPSLLIDLPTLADKLSAQIGDDLSIQKESFIELVIVGKVALASQNDSFAEADLIIKTQRKIFPISVKLSKANAFVNTKSAGLKSFMTKYFKLCDPQRILQRQDRFNNNVDIIINEFGNELYAYNDLEYDGSFREWIEIGRTSLSGELSLAEREIYKKMLYKLNKLIYQEIKSLSQSSHFRASLLPLLGFGDENVIQATAYYKNEKDRYIPSQSIVEDISSIDSKVDLVLGELKTTAANFDIYFAKRTLQIRIKAMNKFTSKSFKLNCAVKSL